MTIPSFSLLWGNMIDSFGDVNADGVLDLDNDLTVDGDVKATVDRIARGGVADYGAFRGQYFGMPDLEGKAKTGVARHLQFHFDRLTVTQFKSFASVD